VASGSASPLKIGWFSTGRGEGSYGLLSSALEAIDSGDLPVELAFVFVNRVKGQTKRTDRFLELVESRGIPLITLSSRDFRRANDNRPWAELREAFDEAAIELLRPHKADIAVHAGYMLIAPLLCSEYLTLNLHPALPGGTIGMWQQAVWDVITGGLDETGAMIHVSTEDVDEGPVLSTAKFSVRGAEFDAGREELEMLDVAGLNYEQVKQEKGEDLLLFQAIRAAGLLRERPLLVETLKAVASHRIDPTGAGHEVDLTLEVEQAVENVR
jgi:phosphoribosylglycinamide formyltransferase-1